uniref:glutathione transferase n=1 Tax=Monodon monoceros TaxID=40151 RepID=A0A8C6CDL3_MONMO
MSGGPPGRAGKCCAAGDRFARNFVCGARCSPAPSLRLSFPGRGEGWERGRGPGAQKVARLNLMSVLCPGYLSQLAHEEKKYPLGDGNGILLNEKSKLGLDFPNLPYLIDGAHKLTQSNTILCYIARKHNMCGETEEEKIRVDVLENQVMDVRLCMAMICYSSDFSVSEGSDSSFVPQEKLKPDYLKEIPKTMKLFSDFLGKRPWFAGDKLTYVHFLAYDILDMHRTFEPRCLDEFPNLKDFTSRFEGLKKISAYMKSSCFLPGPLFLKTAMWGNKYCPVTRRRE